EGFGDARGLLEAELSELSDELGDAGGELRVECGNFEGDDLAFLLDAREVQIEVKATAFERFRELAPLVRGEDHDRSLARDDGAELGDRDLVLGEHLEEECFELFVGLVDLVDQKDGATRGADRPQERAFEEILAREDVTLELVPLRRLATGL